MFVQKHWKGTGEGQYFNPLICAMMLVKNCCHCHWKKVCNYEEWKCSFYIFFLIFLYELNISACPDSHYVLIFLVYLFLMHSFFT